MALNATNVTASRFIANWTSVSVATGHRVDVATDASFTTYVPGYQDLDVGNTTGRNVTGLSANTCIITEYAPTTAVVPAETRTLSR